MYMNAQTQMATAALGKPVPKHLVDMNVHVLTVHGMDQIAQKVSFAVNVLIIIAKYGRFLVL